MSNNSSFWEVLFNYVYWPLFLRAEPLILAYLSTPLVEYDEGVTFKELFEIVQLKYNLHLQVKVYPDLLTQTLKDTCASLKSTLTLDYSASSFYLKQLSLLPDDSGYKELLPIIQQELLSNPLFSITLCRLVEGDPEFKRLVLHEVFINTFHQVFDLNVQRYLATSDLLEQNQFKLCTKTFFSNAFNTVTFSEENGHTKFVPISDQISGIPSNKEVDIHTMLPWNELVENNYVGTDADLFDDQYKHNKTGVLAEVWYNTQPTFPLRSLSDCSLKEQLASYSPREQVSNTTVFGMLKSSLNEVQKSPFITTFVDNHIKNYSFNFIVRDLASHTILPLNGEGFKVDSSTYVCTKKYHTALSFYETKGAAVIAFGIVSYCIWCLVSS